VSYRNLGPAPFPAYQGGIAVNMMPVVIGDPSTVPVNLRGYLPLMEQCSGLEPGTVGYLTINESVVREGETQRRPGIHTEGTSGGRHGGSHGGTGVYMASTDGACRVWAEDVGPEEVDAHGGLLFEPDSCCERMALSALYSMTDRTPHEALPAERTGPRQFFRLVSEDVTVWYAQHNTPNPLGVQPTCRVATHSKFE
jgi:hypothetical protein